MWKWLIAGALIFGIAPLSVQAQNMMGSMRFGRFSQPRMPMVGFGNMGFPMGGFQTGSMFLPLGNGLGLGGSRFTNPYAMNPYAMSSYMMNPYMMNAYMMNPYMSGSSYGNSYGSGSSSMSYDPSGASAGYGGQGYGTTGNRQSATAMADVTYTDAIRVRAAAVSASR